MRKHLSLSENFLKMLTYFLIHRGWNSMVGKFEWRGVVHWNPVLCFLGATHVEIVVWKSNVIPLNELLCNIYLKSSEATLLESVTLLSKSSSLQPQADTDSAGSCLAVKNCSKVISLGRTSPNLTSSFSNNCWTETSEPMARRTSAALPRSERLTLLMTMASW